MNNALVVKNFIFQFVNNYFVRSPLTAPPLRNLALSAHTANSTPSPLSRQVLFYIGYMREFKDPLSGKSHPCEDGNCLPELQMQLMVVFTGKTMGKQIAYTLKPFVFR